MEKLQRIIPTPQFPVRSGSKKDWLERKQIINKEVVSQKLEVLMRSAWKSSGISFNTISLEGQWGRVEINMHETKLAIIIVKLVISTRKFIYNFSTLYILEIFHNKKLKTEYSPDLCGSVGWTSSCQVKGRWFDSQGTCVGCTFRLGLEPEATDWGFSLTLMFFSLPFSLPYPPLKINK